MLSYFWKIIEFALSHEGTRFSKIRHLFVLFSLLCSVSCLEQYCRDIDVAKWSFLPKSRLLIEKRIGRGFFWPWFLYSLAGHVLYVVLLWTPKVDTMLRTMPLSYCRIVLSVERTTTSREACAARVADDCVRGATLVLPFRLFALTQVVNQFNKCILYNWFATNTAR